MTAKASEALRTPQFIRDLLTLQRERAARDRRSVFFVEGVRNFVQAADHHFGFEQIVFSDKLLINPVARKLVRQYRRAGVQTHAVSPEAFRSVSQTRRASGVAAVLRQRWFGLDAISDSDLCWLLLEKVRSPGNLGTLIRSSNAVGGSGILCLGNGVDPYAPDVIRSAMGAVFEQRFIRTDMAALQDFVAAGRCEIIGATPAGGMDLHRLQARDRVPLIALGDERKGLSGESTALCNRLVRIPMREGVDSLNLGVAGSLLLYEMYRCRSAHDHH